MSSVDSAADHRAYADAVMQELETRGELLPSRRIESIFFGGGTPSLWVTKQLERVLEHVRRLAARRADEIEVTVECNPSSLDEDKARALVDIGVNRLSIGVQSLNDARLRFLGRAHDVPTAIAAVKAALRAGAAKVSADLIFGIAGESAEEAKAEALSLVDLGLLHLSCYQLTIEPGTRFGELARRGRLPLAEDGRVADSFLAIEEAMGSRGLSHYEISNYAAPGHESRHNLGYWHGHEYVGLGCGAFGFVRTELGDEASGVRWRNDPRVEVYLRSGGSPRPSAAASPPPRASAAASWRVSTDAVETLDAETLLRERIMLGLRLSEGVDLDRAEQDLRVRAWTQARSRAIDWLERRGRLARQGSVLRIPPRHWLWADDIASRLF